MAVALDPAASARQGVRATEAAPSRTLASQALLAIVALELAVIYAPTVRWLLERWTLSVWHTAHGLLIPPVVAWLVWRELRPLRSLPRAASPWGFAFLVPALVMHIADTGMQTQILSAMSLVVALPGLSLLFLGRVRTRAIALPLAFSVFMLPVPLAMTERIHLVLREITTAGTARVLPLLGVTVFAEPMALNLTNGTLLIGDACSGFSTVYASCAVAVLTAYTCNRRWGRLLVLAAAIPIAIASNIVRIVLLSMLIEYRGMDVLSTWMHPGSGVLTFVIALPLIFWLGRPGAEDAR